MRLPTTKALALLGGVATLALGTSLGLRASAPRTRAPLPPCAPRMLALEQATCEPLPTKPRSASLTAKSGDQLAKLGTGSGP